METKTNAQEMLARVYSMFALPETEGDERVGVACPVCGPRGLYGINYVHLESADTVRGTDHGGEGHPFSSNGKGDVTMLRFWCEARHHRWALVFAGQKGETKVELITVHDTQGDVPMKDNIVPFIRRDVRNASLELDETD